MAFLGRVGNLLKQSGSKHASIGLSSTNSPLFQAIRSMSSAKLFVGGLSYGTDELGLREAFQQYGEVIDALWGAGNVGKQHHLLSGKRLLPRMGAVYHLPTLALPAKVISDRDSGRSRGFGFVSYTSTDSANTALQDMDGKELHGRRIRVNFAQERPRPSFGGGGGYGGVGGGYGGGGGGYGGAGGYSGGGYVGAGGYSGGSGGGYGGGSNVGGYGGGNQNVAGGNDPFNGGAGGGDKGDLNRRDYEDDDYANTSNK